MSEPESTKPYLYFERIMNGIVSIPESVQQKLSNVMLVRQNELQKQREEQKEHEEQKQKEEEVEEKSSILSWFNKSEPESELELESESESKSGNIFSSLFSKPEPEPKPKTTTNFTNPTQNVFNFGNATMPQFEKKCNIRGW